MQTRPLLAAFGLAALVAGSAAADPLSLETARGPVEVAGHPGTIVAYDTAAIDTLDALGVPLAGAPAPLYVPYLEQAVSGTPTVGTLFEPDLEALAQIAPDLIIVGGRSATQLESVARVAPAVDMTIPPDDLVGAVLARLDSYGRLTGREAQAETLEAELQQKLETARAAVAGKGNALVILTNGPKVSAYGAGSRFGWIHTALGLPQAREGLDAQTHGEAVSFEFIAEVDPDWLLVVDRGAAVQAEGESAAQTLDNALIRETKAWKNGHVVYLDPARMYISGGGVQAMTGMLDQIAEVFSAAGG
ncbi:siderophore ABC transporter substrate-binding protein [Mangrovicoccus algicola]|uniref:Siderophore ABC transporter substrate-binding protein n=1 Tax=Mangrovicoccus algicola TaxID=2771008 RepID=A0A8J7CZP6_9RHOB|nr:siderophore ABC transporter substrate-binding protein [Mangrovicoccus algicola]MBE3638218.1 siderophore ABC transporter substrate-binding protein [Mangrovicoccus algicola]